ncbi:glycoside hydrolase family 17 protein [Chaetomium sp. MPI-SDFR-AT-0129]|nr:glycoside hydrolase family 17 protein [Chaetomium sp. MPI-SDFR-AT-0129]
MRPSAALVAGVLAAGASADGTNYLGFNSGATLADRSAKFKDDWLAEFKTAQALNNAPGKFNAVRLYTNIQAYSESDPIQAFEAAIDTNTKILLGIWTSGTDSIDKELTALNKAVKQYGKKFTDLVIGMSIGSEDLYRDSATGVMNKAGVGAGPEVILKFIKQYKDSVSGNDLKSVPVGHVDTWDAWTNGTNKAVIDAVDWLGVDEYPYYESGKGNDIKNAGTLFDRAFNAVVGVAGSKQIWVTETGWPATGKDWDQAHPSVENAKYYWDEVGCRKLFNKVPTFWYNLRDSNPDNEMKFAITNNLSTKPLFDLTCPTHFDTPTGTSTSHTSASSTGASTPGSSSTGGASSGSGSGSSSGTGSQTGSGSETAPSPSHTGAAYIGKSLSGAAVVGLAVVAGVFALF